MFRYSSDGGSYKRAILTVEFLSDEGAWLPVEAQVDTAADVTVLPYSFATRLRFLGMQFPLLLQEVVGSVTAIQTTVRARIVGQQLDLPIVASVNVRDALLGVGGFLDRFIVTFRPDSFEVVPLRR